MDRNRWARRAGISGHAGPKYPVRPASLFEQHNQGDIRHPLLMIDGRPITWDESAAVLMTFEGFRSKLDLLERRTRHKSLKHISAHGSA